MTAMEMPDDEVLDRQLQQILYQNPDSRQILHQEVENLDEFKGKRLASDINAFTEWALNVLRSQGFISPSDGVDPENTGEN